MVVDCKVLIRTLQGRATPIEIEIDIVIGKLPEIDFDHDFDFDIDKELPRVENKNALDTGCPDLACSENPPKGQLLRQ
jgi:hypothetical protein